MPTLQTTLHNLLNRHFTPCSPGAVLLVARGDEIVYQKGAGLANLEKGTPITAETTFRLASVTKQFTAMCVHLLAQRAKLRLEDRLSLYFPELAHFEHVQLLHLLNHTSGLPDFEERIPEGQTAQLSDEDVLRITAAQPHLLFSSGTHYRYSNTAFILLGLLVERVSGTSFADFLKENIFGPLQMQQTILYETAAAIPNRAMGYRRSGAGEFILSDQNIGSATRGDGCLYTSATDYLKWHLALGNNNLFNIKHPLQTYSSSIDDARGWHYSMGWFVSELGNGNRELCHSGDTSGFTNLIIRLPQHDSILACFSNIAQNHAFLHDLLQALKQFRSSAQSQN